MNKISCRCSQLLTLITAVFLVGLATTTVVADTIILRDGREYKGQLLRATDETIEFRQDGKVREYSRAEIVHLHLQRRRAWDEYENASEISDDVLQESLAADIDPNSYPGVGSIVLYQGLDIELHSPHTWTTGERVVIRILNEHGEDESVRNIVYRSDVETARIQHAVTIRPDGAVIHLRESAVQDESLFSKHPRYDTVRRRRFALPEGKPGVVLDAATEVVREKQLAQQIFSKEILLGSTKPVRYVAVTVRVPEGVPLQWKVLNDSEETVEHRHEDLEDGAVLHTWVRRDSPKYFPEPLMPPWQDVIPRLVVSADARSWAEIAHDYDSTLAELQQQFAELPRAPGDTPEALWRYVSRNIQALAVPTAASGRLPGDPMETWRLRSGSPLDRAYLLFRWMQEIGTPVDWAWIKPRQDGALAVSVPSLGVFNVPGIRIGGADPSYLVPGDDLDHIEEPVARLSKSPALSKSAGLDHLPSASPEASGTDRNVRVVLFENGDATVRERLRFRGSSARSVRQWRRLTQEDIENAVNRMVTAIDPRADAVTYRIEGDVLENAREVTLHLEYAVPNFADSGEKLCSFRAPWFNYEARAVGREDRSMALFWRTPRLETVSLELLTPDSFTVVAKPEERECGDEAIRFEALRGPTEPPFSNYSTTYRRSVIAAPVQVYEDLKACLEMRAAVGRQYWVWRKVDDTTDK